MELKPVFRWCLYAMVASWLLTTVGSLLNRDSADHLGLLEILAACIFLLSLAVGAVAFLGAVYSRLVEIAAEDDEEDRPNSSHG